MATVQHDLRGLKCPVPVLRMSSFLMKKEVNAGDVLEVWADCPTFETDVKKWCSDFKKVLLKVQTEGDIKKVQIQI